MGAVSFLLLFCTLQVFEIEEKGTCVIFIIIIHTVIFVSICMYGHRIIIREREYVNGVAQLSRIGERPL